MARLKRCWFLLLCWTLYPQSMWRITRYLARVYPHTTYTLHDLHGWALRVPTANPERLKSRLHQCYPDWGSMGRWTQRLPDDAHLLVLHVRPVIQAASIARKGPHIIHVVSRKG